MTHNSNISQQLEIVVYKSAQDYSTIFAKMIEFTKNRSKNQIDQLWLLEHNPVFTQGNTGDPKHILEQSTIPIIQSDRGGQVTYHGIGQLVVYFMIDIKRKKEQVIDFNHRSLVSAIEKSVVDLCRIYDVIAYAKKDAPGIYVQDNGEEKKLCSLGVKINRKGSYHGMALNIDLDLTPFNLINPCGYQGLKMINLQNLVPNKLTTSLIREQLLILLAKQLNYKQIIRQQVSL